VPLAYLITLILERKEAARSLLVALVGSLFSVGRERGRGRGLVPRRSAHPTAAAVERQTGPDSMVEAYLQMGATLTITVKSVASLAEPCLEPD